MVVKVLEEALGIKSVLAHNFLELLNNLLNDGTPLIGGLSTAVVGQGTRVTENGINVLFKFLLGENLIDCVGESFPAHVLSLFWRLETFS
jgi:hypothetical protein